MRKIAFSLLFATMILGLQAQSLERWVIGTAGGSYVNGATNFYMDYTIGELLITTESNINFTLTQGFQQPFSLAWVSVQDYTEQDVQIFLYPNPVAEQLNIEIQNAKSGEYTVMVFDVLGQLLSAQRFSTGFDGNAKVSCDFQNYATGNYFVRIIHEKKIIQTGKVIKIEQ